MNEERRLRQKQKNRDIGRDTMKKDRQIETKAEEQRQTEGETQRE